MSPPAPAGAGAGPVKLAGSVGELWENLAAGTAAGRRFAGLMATQRPEGVALSAHLAGTKGIATHEVILPPGASSYPALTPVLGAAFWYEREIHDLFGVVPAGHPRLEPLILPLHDEQHPRPRPGTPAPSRRGTGRTSTRCRVT